MKISPISMATYNNSIQFNMFKNQEYIEMRELIDNMLATKKIVAVKFKKVDGTIRQMNCTKDSDIIPTKEETSNVTSRKSNPNVCCVWDVDAKGWRSFRYDSVISVDESV